MRRVGGKPYKYLSSPRVLHHPPTRVESYITLGWQHPSSQLSTTNSLSLPDLKRSLEIPEECNNRPSSRTGSWLLSFPSFFPHSVVLFQQLLCPTGAAAKSHRGKAANKKVQKYVSTMYPLSTLKTTSKMINERLQRTTRVKLWTVHRKVKANTAKV